MEPVNGGAAAAPRAEAAVRRDPARTRDAILDAALAEFSTKGLGGARVDEIAARAGINKRMLYHYFGNKEDLFLAALESVYETIRGKEAALALETLAPEEGMRRLVDFTWRHHLEHPEFITMLNSENLHRARHLRRSAKIRELHSPLVAMIGELLRRGAAAGVFRQGVDPVQLYISIASLAYFYLSNIHTLSTIFARDLRGPAELERRRAHMLDVIMGYLRA